jgi:hypothetical protein
LEKSIRPAKTDIETILKILILHVDWKMIDLFKNSQRINCEIVLPQMRSNHPRPLNTVGRKKTKNTSSLARKRKISKWLNFSGETDYKIHKSLPGNNRNEARWSLIGTSYYFSCVPISAVLNLI